MAELVIDVREDSPVAHVVLSGEFDMAGVEQFESRLRAVEAESPETILIDLAAVEFMDSSGLRAIVSADDRSRKTGRRLAIVPGPSHVRRVFEITQLDERLELVDDPSAVAGA